MNTEFAAAGNELVKIRAVDEDGDSEALWATRLDDNLFRIENCPVLASGISWHDVVEAERCEDGIPVISRVVERSGSRALFAASPRPLRDDEPSLLLQHLEAMGCLYEPCGEKLALIVVPRETDIEAVEKELQSRGWLPHGIENPAGAGAAMS